MSNSVEMTGDPEVRPIVTRNRGLSRESAPPDRLVRNRNGRGHPGQRPPVAGVAKNTELLGRGRSREKIAAYLQDGANVDQMVVFFALSNLIFVFAIGFFAGLRRVSNQSALSDWNKRRSLHRLSSVPRGRTGIRDICPRHRRGTALNPRLPPRRQFRSSPAGPLVNRARTRSSRPGRRHRHHQRELLVRGRSTEVARMVWRHRRHRDHSSAGRSSPRYRCSSSPSSPCSCGSLPSPSSSSLRALRHCQ